jgi:hypothetical protein
MFKNVRDSLRWVGLGSFALLIACGGSDEEGAELGVALQKLGSLPEQDQARASCDSEQETNVSFRWNGSRLVEEPGPPLKRGRMTADDYARIERARAAMPNVPAPTQHVDSRSMTERAIDKARSLEPDELVDIGVQLVEPGFDFCRLRGTSGDERRALIDERRAGQAPSVSALTQAISAIGGQVLGTSWLVNVVKVRVRADQVTKIAAWPRVVAVSIGEPVHEEGAWHGKLVRQSLQLDGVNLGTGKKDFYQGCFESPVDGQACHDGATGSRSGGSSRQRIAFFETDLVNRNHVGWRDTAGGASRIQEVMNCSAIGCGATAFSGSGDNHGTAVAWAAAGSIEQGQDSNFPLSSGARTDAQRQRSGVSKEANIYYYYGSSTDGVREAIEQATAEGVDVFNWSGAYVTSTCNSVNTLTYDVSSINAAIVSGTNAGMVFVKSAGNDGNAGCRITYPAWRPEVLTVGGLEGDTVPADPNNAAIYSLSSRGGATLRKTGSSTDRTFSGVALMANAFITNYFNNDSNGYASAIGRDGTSFAAPAVAATTALVRDSFVTFNSATLFRTNAYALLTSMLLLGDGWDSDTSTKKLEGIGTRSGFGRLHAHYISSSGLNNTAPANMNVGATFMTTGQLSYQTISSTALSSAVTQLKVVVLTFDPDLAATSDVIVNVQDTCDGNNVLAQDSSYDIRKRVHLLQSNANVWERPAGKCPRVEIDAAAVPSPGRWVFWGWSYHSGNPNQH